MNLSYERPALRQILICLVLFVLLIGTAMTSTTDRHVANHKLRLCNNLIEILVNISNKTYTMLVIADGYCELHRCELHVAIL